jgi:hypothetical protein
VGLVLFGWILSIPSQENPKREIPCKTPENAKTCYWTHGRINAGNGTPSFRLWIVGTHHKLGIYSGPSVDREGSPDNEYHELPANLLQKFKPFKNWVFADFEVCPLEPERPGEMQAACVESAKNIVVGK